jgi:regulator of replication initiation timing
MMIEVNYVHFHNLNRNVLDLGKQVRELADENARLKAEVERLRFIGDEIIMDVYRSECLTDKWCKMARKWDAAKEGKQP